MKIIEEFIDSLFSGVVETSETKQLKADLLANAEDRYEDLLSQGKSENEAIGTIISEFGTIDELMEELNLENKQVDETNDSMNGLPEISVEEGLDYLAVQRKGAIQIGLGLVCLFIGVAIGVPLFIVAGNRFVAMDKQLGQRLIPIKLKKEVAQREQSFQRSFIFCMAAGVVFCILGLIPVVVFSSGLHLMMRRSMHQMMGGQYYNGTMGISWLFFLVSVGVFLFIFGGVIKGSFNKLLNETYFYSEHVGHPDFAPQQTKTEEGPVGNPVGAIIASVYWPLVVALYLFISFVLGDWRFSWLIFMFAGIFYNTIQAFLHKH
ncbi:MAG: permease prefix domain 1-containing protein [Enterococcus faecalis]|nr:permease prefix domain 1-containing protein [Enterococcus faecalis]MDU2876075.1 permease prefix domain 1-containing protein [Enterococcus faecalis]